MFRAFPQCWESDSSDEDSEDDLSCPPLLPRDVGDSDSESEDEEEMPKLVAARWRGDEEEVEEKSWLVDAEDEEDRGAPASSQPGDFTKSVVPTGSAVEGEGQGKGGEGAAEPTLTNEKGGRGGGGGTSHQPAGSFHPFSSSDCSSIDGARRGRVDAEKRSTQ